MRCEELAEVVSAPDEGVVVDDWRATTCRDLPALPGRAGSLPQARPGPAALRGDLLQPEAGLVADVMACLEDAGERHALRSLLSGHKVAYVGGLAVATAGAAGAFVIASRTRGRRVALAG